MVPYQAITQHITNTIKYDNLTTTTHHAKYNINTTPIRATIDYRYPCNHLCFAIHITQQELYVAGQTIPLADPELIQKLTKIANQHKQQTDQHHQERIARLSQIAKEQ